MTTSDKIDHLIVLAELYADNKYAVPLADRRDGSEARKKKTWYSAYRETLDLLKRGFLGVKTSVECGYVPHPPRAIYSHDMSRGMPDGFESVTVYCYNADEGCRNETTKFVRTGDKPPRWICPTCNNVGSPEHRGYASMGDATLVMGATPHAATP